MRGFWAVFLWLALVAAGAASADVVSRWQCAKRLGDLISPEDWEEDPRANGDWSDERFGDVLAILAFEEIPLDPITLREEARDLTLQAIAFVLGKRRPVPSLMNAATHLHGNWRKALVHHDYDPDEEMQPKSRPFWTKDRVVIGLRALAAAGRSLYYDVIRNDRTRRSQAILGAKEVLGQKRTAAALFKKAIELYGTWDAALAAAGLDADAIRREGRDHALSRPSAEEALELWDTLRRGGTVGDPARRRRFEPRANNDWDEERIGLVLRILKAEEILLDRVTLQEDLPIVLDAIAFVTGKRRPGSSLVNAGVGRWKNWTAALAHFGYDPALERRERAFWTRERIVAGIVACATAGWELWAAAMEENRAPVPGIGRTGSGLYQAAMKLFDSWDDALRAAGQDPAIIKQRAGPEFWTPERATKAIAGLHALGVDLAGGAISRDSSEATRSLIGLLLGFPTSGASLYQEARRFFGSWPKAIRAAGLDPGEVCHYWKWKPEDIRAAIRLLDAEGVALNAWAIQRDLSLPTRALMKEAIGREATGRALYNAAAKQYGLDFWDKALRDAGKEPREIRRRHWARSQVVLVSLQLERLARPGAVLQWTRSDREGRRLPAREATTEEYCDTLLRVVEELPASEQPLAMGLVDTLVDSGAVVDTAALVTLLSFELRRGVAPEELRRAATKLVEHPSLRRFRRRGNRFVVEDENTRSR